VDSENYPSSFKTSTISNTKIIPEWLKLTERTRRNIFEETAHRVGLPNAAAVEKDWWVVRTLELVFASTIAPHTVLKGGSRFYRY
jgi:hypothetical protein